MIYSPLRSPLSSALRASIGAGRRLIPPNSPTNWDFANYGLAGTPLADLTRGGLGTLIDASGLVAFGAHNLLLQSHTPATTPWGLTGGSISGNVFTESTANSQHASYQLSIPVSPGVYTQIVRASLLSGTRYISVYPQGTAVAWAIFDLLAGARVSFGGGWHVDSGLVAIGGGEYRCWVTINQIGSVLHSNVYMTDSPSAPASGYLGDGSSATRFRVQRIIYGGIDRAANDDEARTTTAARYLPRRAYDPITLKSLGLLVEGANSTAVGQHSLTSPALVTQTVTVTSGTQYTVSFYGAGSVVLSGAASATVAGLGAGLRKTYAFTAGSTSLTFTPSGSVNYPQCEPGPVATSYIPNPGTGTAVRVADYATLSVTGAVLAAAFPAGWGQNTIVIWFRKRYLSAANEVLFALSAGSSYGPGNGLLLRTSGSVIEVGGNNIATQVGGIPMDGGLIKAAVSWSGATLKVAANGSISITLTNADFTGVGTTALVLGALTTNGGQAIAAYELAKLQVLPGQYLSDAALQSLTV